MSDPGTPEKAKRGFALLDRDRVAEMGRKGGRSAHRLGRAHEFSSEEARKAGSKGGRMTQAQKRSEKLREIALAAGNIGRNE